MTISFFKETGAEMDTIMKIVDRAEAMAKTLGQKVNRMHMAMDLSACHSNGCPLRFGELLVADDFNFAHDVFGIERHINRKNGKLENCFVPRFAVKQ